MTGSDSPFRGVPPKKWAEKAEALIRVHPLSAKEITDIVLKVWEDILSSTIGKRFRIGVDIFPKPQIMAFFLHELIPLEVAARHPRNWRGDKSASEKDLVYIPDSKYSIEIKASSHSSQIFGNRSYAQPTKFPKKLKSGYCLAINFQKFIVEGPNPNVIRIRFGWLDHRDWAGQRSPTGQQARLSVIAERSKLLQLYPSNSLP